MIKRNQKFIRFLNLISDSVFILFSYWIAVWINFTVLNKPKSADYGIWHVLIVYSLIIPGIYYLFRVYTQRRLKNAAGEYVTIGMVNAGGTVFLGSLFYLFRLVDFSRLVLLLFWIISTVLVILKHVFGRMIIMNFRELGYNRRHVILVGNGKCAYRYIKDISSQKRLGFEIDGYLSAVEKPNLGKCLGKYEDLESILEKYEPDEVVIALEAHEIHFLPYVLDVAGKEGVAVSMIPFYSNYIPPHPEIEVFGNTKLINMRATPMDNAIGAFLKRGGDIVISFLMLFFLSPLMVVTAIGVKCSSPGPVFFKQLRVGKNKKTYYMYKFRSMRVNSAEKTAWSTSIDQRRTKFGSFIRKYSIDELPQLFNVLKGDMSLVGPRPEIPYYVRKFKRDVPFYLVRQQVRPGMTGWAQIHGFRGDTSIEGRVRYDIWYIEHWSLWLDIEILFKTVFLGKFKNEERILKKS